MTLNRPCPSHSWITKKEVEGFGQTTLIGAIPFTFSKNPLMFAVIPSVASRSNHKLSPLF